MKVKVKTKMLSNGNIEVYKNNVLLGEIYPDIEYPEMYSYITFDDDFPVESDNCFNDIDSAIADLLSNEVTLGGI